MANGMDSAVDMLKDLLSSPDAGEKISSLLGAFQNGSGSGDKGSLDLSGIAGLLGGDIGGNTGYGDSAKNMPAAPVDLASLPVASILNLTQEYQNLSRRDDPRINLLNSLRPYLQTHRIENLENAIKIMGWVKLLPLLGKFKDII